MATSTLQFGYYPRPLDLQSGNVTISTLLDLEQKVAGIDADPSVEGEWIYAPLQERHKLGAGIRQMPYPSRVFGLHHTHRLHHARPDNDDHLHFHLWVLSLFTGMRLTATDAGFLDATPIVPAGLVDFVAGKSDLVKALGAAEAFWRRNSSEPRNAQRFAAAVHTLFMAQNPQLLQFEEFIHLYTAFDACFALTTAISPPAPGARIAHAARIEWMCGRFGMPVPAWAQAVPSAGSLVSALRNDALHEALYVGQPLGFAIHSLSPGLSVTLEMRALICRFLVALLDTGETSYVVSRVGSRQMHGLQMP